jgi:hypothetical protein
VSTYYAQQPWVNGSAGETPVTAETLEHIEQGIDGAHDRIDALAVGTTLVPTPTRTSTVPPAAGQLVTYDASAGNLGPIPLPNPQPGVILGMVKGDASSNTITFTSGFLQGNGGSTTIALRTTGENRTLYGSSGAWFVSGLRAPVVGTTAGTVAAGNDSRFANTLTTALYGGPTRTGPPLCEVWFTAAPFTVGAFDIYAGGGWTAKVDTDGMLGNVGNLQVVNIPLTGRYSVAFHVASTTSLAGSSANCRVTRNSASFTASIAVDARPTVANNALLGLDAFTDAFLNQGDQLYWANYCGVGVQTVAPAGIGSNTSQTRIVVRYIGPT